MATGTTQSLAGLPAVVNAIFFRKFETDSNGSQNALGLFPPRLKINHLPFTFANFSAMAILSISVDLAVSSPEVALVVAGNDVSSARLPVPSTAYIANMRQNGATYYGSQQMFQLEDIVIDVDPPPIPDTVRIWVELRDPAITTQSRPFEIDLSTATRNAGAP